MPGQESENSNPDIMDAYAGVLHGDDNADMPPLPENADSSELLDYMVLVLSRRLHVEKAFKGGYMLNQLLGNNSRMTYDVDFSIHLKEDYEQVKHVLQEIADQFMNMGIIKDYKLKDTIEERMSGGIDFYGDDGRKILGADVGLHDIHWGIRQYQISVAVVQGFEIERMLSDKLIAILSRKRFRRTKDLYDFFAIICSFDCDYQKLSEYIKRRGNAEWENIPFSDVVLIEYKKAWEKLILRSSVTGEALYKPEFSTVIQQFYKIALPLKAEIDFQFWDHLKQELR